MVDQTSVNGRATARESGPDAAHFDGFAAFVDDLASLAELQTQLAAADLRDAARKAAVPMALTVMGLTVITASVPVALFGAGRVLASALNIHEGWALLATSGAAVVLAGLAAGLGAIRLRHSFDSFRRSRKQLMLNIAWVRAVLVTSASVRSHARRRS